MRAFAVQILRPGPQSSPTRRSGTPRSRRSGRCLPGSNRPDPPYRKRHALPAQV